MADDLTKTPRLFNGAMKIDALQQSIQDTESEVGPINGLGAKGGDTQGTFDATQDPPDPVVEVVVVASLPPPGRDGYDTICSGNCMVGGNSTPVAAYRKKAS